MARVTWLACASGREFRRGARAIRGSGRDGLSSRSHSHRHGPDSLIWSSPAVTANRVRRAVEGPPGRLATELGRSAPLRWLSPSKTTAWCGDPDPAPGQQGGRRRSCGGHAGAAAERSRSHRAAQVMNHGAGRRGRTLNSRLGGHRDPGRAGLAAYTVESFFDAGWYRGRSPWRSGRTRPTPNDDRGGRFARSGGSASAGSRVGSGTRPSAYLTGRFRSASRRTAGMADVLWVMEFYRLRSRLSGPLRGLLSRRDARPGERRRAEVLNPDRADPGRGGSRSRRRRPVTAAPAARAPLGAGAPQLAAPVERATRRPGGAAGRSAAPAPRIPGRS